MMIFDGIVYLDQKTVDQVWMRLHRHLEDTPFSSCHYTEDKEHYITRY